MKCGITNPTILNKIKPEYICSGFFMEKIDYLIVGDGYAAVFFAHQLIKAGNSFRLFSAGKKSASHISAGVVNPVILKKFTTFWHAQDQIDRLHEVLAEMEAYLNVRLFDRAPVARVFHDENERKLWQKKAGQEDLQDFLAAGHFSVEGIKNPYGCGRVKSSGRLNVALFFSSFMDYLRQHRLLLEEQFSYENLNPEDRSYKSFSFGKVVFCEGIKVKENPFFNSAAVLPNKGHRMTVSLGTEPSANFIFKKKHFLFPLAEKRWYYGGTYDRDSRSDDVDAAAVEQLEAGLSELYPGTCQLVNTEFGFRPTVADRRPLLGSHHRYPFLYIFNGLGARGVLNGAYFSGHLFEYCEGRGGLWPEVDWRRFKN